ncbi:MAG: LacI family transcriptional regulator [Armatimonadota bacterium]|nr:LacI family transcriptional regulator [Armatimonadota bacterium]
MPVTLQDVAARANVSLATVSKVLNNRYDVAPETVELVEKAIAELGYQRAATRRGRPSAAHPPANRSRRTQVAASIALLIPARNIVAMQSPLTGHLIDGVEAVARERGFHLLLTRLAEDGSLPACLDPVQVDGLIVRSTSRGMAMTLPSVPMVWIFKSGFGPTPGDLVQPDNEMIGQMAARYLLERGHRYVAVVNPRPEHPEAQTRADRFVKFAQAAGATTLAIESESLATDEIVTQLLSHTPPITGLFMPLGDDFVESLYGALLRRGVRCGEDMALISCNNDAVHLRTLDPRLPNIDIRASEIGRAAAETLLWRIQHPHEHRRCILIEPQVVEPAT